MGRLHRLFKKEIGMYEKGKVLKAVAKKSDVQKAAKGTPSYPMKDGYVAKRTKRYIK